MYVCMSYRPHTKSPNYSSDIDTITYCYFTQLDTASCPHFSHDLYILNAYTGLSKKMDGI